MKKTIIFSAVALIAAIGVSAFAQTTPSAARTANASAIACVGAAVANRESALSLAIGSYAQAISSAYGTRSAALQTAYSAASVSQVRDGVKSAWTTFKSALKNATKNWRTARTSAWSTFKTAAKACKAPSSVNDSGNASSESGGSIKV